MENYLQLLFYSDNSENTLTRAANIKFDHMPEHIYKYRAFNKMHFDALVKGVLYTAPLDSFNDIRESNLFVSDKAQELFFQRQYDQLRKENGFPPAEVHNSEDLIATIENHFRHLSWLNGVRRKMPQEMLKGMQRDMDTEYQRLMGKTRKDIRNTFCACSFSASNRIIKMWGQYADCYKGFCIEYDFRSLGRDNLLTALLFPIIYVDDTRVIINDLDNYDPGLNLLAATLKTKEWQYEEEWRLIFSSDKANKPQPMPKPTAIYLGDRTDLQNTKLMKYYCATNHIPLYRMTYDQRNDILEAFSVE